MKKRSLRYAGDKAVRALLERYACPTSFHVVRTRLLGNIATPKLDASPLRAIESCWEGELPEFDNVGAANELFESLMGLWNVYVPSVDGDRPGSSERCVPRQLCDSLADGNLSKKSRGLALEPNAKDYLVPLQVAALEN